MIDKNEVYDFLIANKSAAKIFDFLIANADKNRISHGCSYLYMHDALDLSIATISKAINLLKSKEYIIVHKSDTSHIYEINEEIYNAFRK